MTAFDTSFAPPIDGRPASAPSLANTFMKLATMSWPIMLGAMVMALLHAGQAALLGNIDDTQPLYLISMLQPWYLLFFAFLEALAITGQVFSAKSKFMWPKGGLKIAVVFLSILGLCLLGALLSALQALQGLLVITFTLIDQATFDVLPLYLLTLLPFILFEILNGALRGQGRTLQGFVVLAMAVVVNLGLTYYLLTEKAMGIDALFIGNLVSGLLAAVLISIVFLVEMRGAEKAQLVLSLIRAGTLLAVVGAPVFFSMVVSFLSSSVLFDRMDEFGQEQAVGFLLTVRFRFFLLIPATALATALAVLVNQAEGDAPEVRTARLTHGVVTLLALYALLIAGLYIGYEPLVALMVEAPEIRLAADALLRFLLPTYILVAFVVFSHIILENLGRGTRAFAWTVVLEAGTVYTIWAYGSDVVTAVWILIASALIYGVVFASEYGLLVRQQARKSAQTGATQDVELAKEA